MSNDPAAGPVLTLEALATRLGDDLVTLDKELGEVDLLITQARTEAARHEGRRTAAADKLAAIPPDDDPKVRLDQTAALVTLTKRAALMESQVDVLEGKRRALARYREALAFYVEAVQGLAPGSFLVGALPPSAPGVGAGDGAVIADSGGALIGAVGTRPAATGDTPLPAAVSRLVLGAQEDLRREIARAMHDGPAQSLTNIVLQAQIVERLVQRDPASAAGEVRQLTAMVQQTLDATKSFIFDVRPMVLDDLGLVPTLRRATRERGRRAGIAVEFDSLGNDRRLPMDLESGLFRMLDEAMADYLATGPDRVSVRLDWGEQLEARVAASRAVAEGALNAGTPTDAPPDSGSDLPPALAAMMADRRADEREAAEAAVRDSIVALTSTTWREIQGRAGSIGVTAELLADGAELRLVVDLPAAVDTAVT